MQILLAFDTSAASRTALAEVATRTWPPGSRVEVLTVVDKLEPWTLGEITAEVNARAQQLVEGAAEKLRLHELAADGRVAEGDPKTVILDHAATLGADLIVMGAHGTGAVEQFFLGSVSKAVLRHAPCSVAIVRNTTVQGDMVKVLLAVDGSEGSRRAAESVVGRPWPAGTEVRVLSAVELGLSALQAAFEIPSLDAAHLELQRAAAMARAEEAIDSARKILEAAGLVTSESISVLVASPKEIILQEAAEWPANLIVVGSNGRGALDRFLLGSTSEAVATHATCSVEVIFASRSNPSGS
jgi:nucleotide-binding universal stress UspA family protein